MSDDPKQMFVRQLRGVAVDWDDVWYILQQMYGQLKRTDAPLKEDCFRAMEEFHSLVNWWNREWVLRGEHYPRQEQVEQEFDLWFQDKCAAEKKFLPRWYTLKCQIQERRRGK